jgi:hypothetical protein
LILPGAVAGPFLLLGILLRRLMRGQTRRCPGQSQGSGGDQNDRE